MTLQATAPSGLEAFQWQRQPEAETLVHELVADFLAQCSFAADLARRMREETGTRFVDWIDFIEVVPSDTFIKRLAAAGFQRQSVPGAEHRYVQEQGIFPAILATPKASCFRVGLKVDSVADFMARWRITFEHPIEGEPMSPLRRAMADLDGAAELWVIERHGYRGFEMPEWNSDKTVMALKVLEMFRRRVRDWGSEHDGFSYAEDCIDTAILDVGRDMACDLWFAAEREYWMRRNRAAQVQYARQQKLGLGWANHDHHTYRSSRRHFSRLVGIFEKLGFVCRERFYAGREAGWGAQVMEQPVAGIITFNDVDLSPDELFGDFAHEPLPERKELGTIGLWCGLHGESFLEAGMHHLECQFDFEALRKQLEEEAGIKTMKPFTDFPYLRQAFTEGERWPVRPERINALLKDHLITEAQAKQFREAGAIGSHLENLERNEGFKGFNQKGVSEIISETDPRKQR